MTRFLASNLARVLCPVLALDGAAMVSHSPSEVAPEVAPSAEPYAPPAAPVTPNQAVMLYDPCAPVPAATSSYQSNVYALVGDWFPVTVDRQHDRLSLVVCY